MILTRLGAHHVRAATLATRAAGRLYPPLATRRLAPASSASALANPSLTNDHLTVTRTSYSTVNEANKDSAPYYWGNRQLAECSTFEAWSRRLQTLNGRYMKDLAFWNEAFSLAEAKFGAQGIRAMFEAFILSGHAPSPTVSLYQLRLFPEDILPQSDHEASHDDETAAELSYLEAFCSYVRLEKEQFHRRPPAKDLVYQRVLSRVLLMAPEKLAGFHLLLSHLSPSKQDVIDLIVANARLPQHQQAALQKFYSTLPTSMHASRYAYEEIVRPLCLSGEFPAAMSWHQSLLQQGKRPQDPALLEPLRAYLHRSGQPQEAMKFEWLRDGAKHSYEQPHEAQNLERLGDSSKQSDWQAVATRVEQLFPQGQIKRSEWSDAKTARIYATRFLSLNMVVSTLRLFNVSELGPSSIREMLLRCSNDGEVDVEELRAHFKLLQQADITANRSVYGLLALKLLEEGDVSTLSYLATNDVHPDEFDDPNVLTSILLQLDPSDRQQWNVIQSALLLGIPEEREDSETQNLLLRRQVLRDDHGGTFEILERMRIARIPASSTTLQLMYQQFMRKQRNDPSKAPYQVEQFSEAMQHESFSAEKSLSRLQHYSALLSFLMESGQFVPPSYWDDILRSMLLLGALDAHETLCLKIARWYQDEKHAKKYEVQKVVHPHQVPPQRAVLFRPQCVVEIIMHYMYHGQSAPEATNISNKTLPAKIRAGILASHPVFRGLRLLLQLRAAGIHLDIAEIQRFLRTRIWLVCRKGCKLASGRVVRRLENLLERDYHLAIEILIGARDPVLQDMRYRGEREVKKRAQKTQAGRFDEILEREDGFCSE